ncbi:hypothetical protein MANES_03G031096v8 [Manihot esculenta]|uniref:Uncharacterized protein n=1 Tax=Manihot esculenta TaxID=3983 RepID=A0ACB7HYB8_MANES|nr:hypothetical protein MANES_03G031096v8 [Manihot esculenta]
MGWQSTGLQCFSDWFRVVFVSVGVENATKMIMICWSLWYNRNLIVWEHKFKSPQQVYSLSMRYLQEWRAAATPLVQQNGSNVSSRSWQRPDSSLGFIGIGVVVRDENVIDDCKSIIFNIDSIICYNIYRFIDIVSGVGI